jgi:kynurenine formamidase
MKIIDLTHTIQHGMPFYPGTLPPRLERVFTIDDNGFAETRLDILSHIGTHMDAPAHLLAGAKTLDMYLPDAFIGKCRVIKIPCEPDYIIDSAFLHEHEKALRGTDFILFNTGWDKHWGSEHYFAAYPTLAPEAAEWLCSLPIKGVGIDAISFDPADSLAYPVHRFLLGKGILLAENLTNLQSIEKQDFMIAMLPLKFEGADGAPARIMAWYS